MHVTPHVPSLALARAVADFAQRPLAHQHPSWLPREWPLPLRSADRFGAAAAQVLAGPLSLGGGDERARALLLQSLVDGRGDPLARLVLLDRSALRLLAIWCGMAVHKPGFASERSRLAQQLDGRLGGAGPAADRHRALPAAARRAALRSAGRGLHPEARARSAGPADESRSHPRPAIVRRPRDGRTWLPAAVRSGADAAAGGGRDTRGRGTRRRDTRGPGTRGARYKAVRPRAMAPPRC
ncbi:hypothetical protein [Cupriavidus sp. H18C1]|uniref:hypothetical protein n=1 Tax=Cupriavidus sp. H18C1 TaxID=3241601 RepID=UPI003BB9868A